MTTSTDVFIPEILDDTVRGVFARKNAFMGSLLVQLGIVKINDTFDVSDASRLGDEVTVPYFGTLGEFANNPDGSSVTPSKVAMTNEKSTISRDSLAFEVTAWASGAASEDPYTESANQIVEAATRAMDKAVIDAAKATGVPTKDVYSATTPRKIDYDLAVDAKYLFGDEAAGSCAMAVHSKTYADMLKLKGNDGRPLLLQSQREGEFDRFAGMPVVVSDRMPLDGSTMSTPVSTGTSPPVLTITGTPTGAWNLSIDCVVGGAHATATYRFSTDGGQTWSATITTLGVGVAQALTDTAVDSVVGNNGATGLSVAFAAGTFNADNLWTSAAALKALSLILKPNALAFWYNRQALSLQTDKDILADARIGAMHLYRVAHRYRRAPGMSRPGVVRLIHNVSPVS